MAKKLIFILKKDNIIMECTKVSIRFEHIYRTFYVVGFPPAQVLDALDFWLISLSSLSASLSKLDVQDLFLDEVSFDAHLFYNLTKSFPTISLSKKRRGKIEATISVHISDKQSCIKLNKKIVRAYSKPQFSTLVNVLVTATSIFLDLISKKITQKIHHLDKESPLLPQKIAEEMRKYIHAYNLSDPEVSLIFQKIDEYLEN